jgi:hypothetical protein
MDILGQIERYGVISAIITVVWMFLRFLQPFAAKLTASLDRVNDTLTEVRDLIRDQRKGG